MNLTPKNANKLYCEECDFKCSKPCDWKRHIATRKHKNRTFLNDLEHNNAEISNSLFICECGKEYPARNSLWYHKKKCGIVQSPETTKTEIVQDIDKELLIKLLLKNSDVMEKMLEIMPQIGNTTNSHNTTNNQFNIQMFLNDHCKNAMNLTDFVQSLPITSETYDSTIENGLTKTIANLMVNGLNELDILERPIHCTDASRKTLYVKESDVWEKDTELLHVIESIKYLSVKHRGMIKTWKEANEGWQTNDKLQYKMSTLIIHSMKLIERDERETSKIIRSISKNVYLDNETKKCYI
jgi:hypothetical protein